MRIKPVQFNYLEMKKQVPDLEVTFGRKNVVLKNDKYTMWGESLDKETGLMGLTSLSLSRSYSKDSKQDIYDEWENFLNQFATELPEEISMKLTERAANNETLSTEENEEEIQAAI